MSDRWVVDADYPAGRLVAMTPDEEAQLERDRKAGAVVASALAKSEAAAAARIAGLKKARADLAGGVIFASCSAKERSVLDMLLAGGPLA
jgi:hypothetical protein